MSTVDGFDNDRISLSRSSAVRAIQNNELTRRTSQKSMEELPQPSDPIREAPGDAPAEKQKLRVVA